MRQIGLVWRDKGAERPRAVSRTGGERVDALRHRQRPARHVGVQQLNHLAVELDRGFESYYTVQYHN